MSTRTSTPRGAWLVWGVGVLAYTVAVFHRTSLGVAGLDAADRFDASASVLATFAVVQLLVYATLQVPVGVLLDRFGARRLLVSGAVLMAVGQLALALTTTVELAIAARVLVGAGDAATFISVLRLVVAWFPARRNPLLVQMTALVGQIGQIASAVPIIALLHGPGWSATFVVAAALGVLDACLVLLLVRDAPPGTGTLGRISTLPELRRGLVESWREPGTRLGFWTHFATLFSAVVFVLLWGFPFLTAGQGLSATEAGGYLTLFVLMGIGFGPFVGHLVARYPMRRSWVVLTSIAATVLVWTLVLTWPGRAPHWLLLLLIVVLAGNGPASMVGFDYARTFNPAYRLGGATGLVNMGGFIAALSTILLIGLILDAASPADGQTYHLPAFRAAFAVQYVIWGVGVVGILRSRRLARARLDAASQIRT